jgi:hypothetical protein
VIARSSYARAIFVWSISPSSFDAFRQALWIVEFLELLLSGADAKPKFAKALDFEVTLDRPGELFAFIGPYLPHLFAVFRNEVGLSVNGAAVFLKSGAGKFPSLAVGDQPWG